MLCPSPFLFPSFFSGLYLVSMGLSVVHRRRVLLINRENLLVASIKFVCTTLCLGFTLLLNLQWVFVGADKSCFDVFW